jgi:hypothetical protein
LPRLIIRHNRSIALLFILVLTSCAGFPVPSGQAPRIKAITPEAIDPLVLPVKITLTGAGFLRGTTIRLSHPSNPGSVIEVRPDCIDPERLVFTLRGKPLTRLLQTAMRPLPPTKRALAVAVPLGFVQVVAVNPSGAPSNRVVVHLKNFPARIRAIASPSTTERHPLHVRAGTRSHFQVILEGRELIHRDLTLTIEGYTIADPAAPRRLVPGITGRGRAPAGLDTATADINIGSAVPAGEYEIEVGIAECVSCPHLSGILVVEPNDEVTCLTCGPLFAPSGVEIILLDPRQERVGVRWVDQSVREEGFRIEGSWGAPISWVSVADVGPRQGIGIVEWQGQVQPPSWVMPQYHCYRVVVWNSFGELYSQYDCGPPDAPRPPTGLHVIGTTAHRVTLEWLDNSTTETDYEVWRAYCQSCPYHIAVWAAGHPDGTGPVQLEDGPLASDTAFCFEVRAKNEYGSSRSNIVCAQTDYEPPPPTAPGKLGLTGVTQNSIKLEWRDFAHTEDGFWVQRRPPDGSWQNRHNLPANENTGWMNWTDTGLAAGTTYCYRIKAYNEYGTSFSSEKCATTIAGTPPNPDLVVDAVWIPEPTTPNTKFHVAYRVCNMGASVTENFRDKVIKDGDLANAKTVNQGPIPAYRCYESAVEYSGVPQGCYWWDVLIDEGGKVSELNESNNYGWLNACFW